MQGLKLPSRVIFLCLFLLHGCQLEPPYAPPAVDAPAQWKYAQEEESLSIPVEDWWDIFNDPILDGLEEQAIAHNPGLQAMWERVKEARDFAGIVKSKLFPQLNFDPYYVNQGLLIEQFSVTGNHFLRAHQRDYALPLKLSYEADLWGRYRDEFRSAELGAEAQTFDYQSAYLILTTDLAIAYFQLRTQDALLDLFKETIATRKKALSINQSRFRNQISNYTPVALSELDLSNVETQFEDAIRLRGEFENLIAVLIGTPPAEFALASAPLREMPPKIPAGSPAEIILRRPDLAAQERTVASIHAQIGVAYASYFPSIELIGQGGILSPNFHDFLTYWSRLWMYGVNISQYVFDAGARDYRVKMTWAEYREAVALYKQRTLEAFGEVEDALLNIEQIALEMTSTQNSINAAHKAYSIAFNRYLQGAGFYLEVADDERQLLDNQRVYMTLLGLSYFNTVQLIKALGGGWH